MMVVPLEIIIGNAFAVAVNKGKTFLSFSVIEKYAEDVRENVTPRKMIYYFGRDEMRKTLQSSPSFIEAEENGVRGIRFVGNPSVQELRNKYSGHIPLDLAVAFSRTKLNL